MLLVELVLRLKDTQRRIFSVYRRNAMNRRKMIYCCFLFLLLWLFNYCDNIFLFAVDEHNNSNNIESTYLCN